MEAIPLFDAHLHRVHAPLTEYPTDWTYLSCAAGPQDWTAVIEDRQNTVRPFLGIHPENIKAAEEPGQLEKLEQLLSDNPDMGVGEVGLDRRYYRRLPRQNQEALLQAQLVWAVQSGRPVILHQVHALGALLEQLGRLPDQVPMLLHGFCGNSDQARQISSQGLYVSLGPGPHWNTEPFIKALKLIPKNRILLETDWPYVKTISPKGYRQIMEDHYSQASLITGIDREELIRIVHTNGKVFTDRSADRQGKT